MNPIRLEALDGSNPLAFLAALGALVAADEAAGAGPRPTLRWEFEGVWRPVLTASVPDADALITLLDADRRDCLGEPALRFTYPDKGKDVPDVKPFPEDLASALREWVKVTGPDRRRTLDWFSGFIGEGAVDNNGRGKPSALHFTAGQQQFLKAACALVEGVTADDLREAVFGPWMSESKLPVMGWDNTETRDYALRASDPSKEKKTGTPGADWLATRGLALLTVVAVRGEQKTPGVEGGWKSGKFAWPLWTHDATRPVVHALLRTPGLRKLDAWKRERRGIGAVHETRILRSDQGGYGSVTPVVVR